MTNVLTILRRLPRRPLARAPLPIRNRPVAGRSVGVFAIRIGPAGARRFRSSLARLDAAVRESLAATEARGRELASVRPVATVLLPEALHLVVCGPPESVQKIGDRLLRALEDCELDGRLTSVAEGAGSGRPESAGEARLRLSIIRAGGLAAAAGTVLDLPSARGLVSSGTRWPYSRAGEA